MKVTDFIVSDMGYFLFSEIEGGIYYVDKKGEIINFYSIIGFDKYKITEFKDFDFDGKDIYILGKEKVVVIDFSFENKNEFNIDMEEPCFIEVVHPFGIFVLERFYLKVCRYSISGEKRERFYLNIREGEIIDFEFSGDFFYFYTEKGKIYRTNIYGNIVDSFMIIKGKEIEVKGNCVFVLKDNGICIFKNNSKISFFPVKGIDMFLYDDYLYFLKGNSILKNKIECK